MTHGREPTSIRAVERVPDVTVRPGRVFDREVGLEATPAGYAAMNDRTALKVMVRP